MADNESDLEQIVNYYDPPCREIKEIEDMYASMANFDRLKLFYRSLAAIIYFAPVITYSIAAKKEMYEITSFIDKNFTTLQILGLVLGITCLYVGSIYKNKSLEIYGEMVDFEEKQLSKESLE